MRLLEHKIPLRGVILVAAAYTDLGDEYERRSEYFNREWKWQDMKEGARDIICFHGTNDPLIPVEEARYIAEAMKGDNFAYHELETCGHFHEPWPEILSAFDANFGMHS